MKSEKRIKDVMVDVFKYPHIPYWFTIKQAIMIIKKSAGETEKLASIILVFDEKYNLMGTLTTREILMDLEPALLKPDTEVGEAASMFGEEAKKRAERQVSEIMIPTKHFVEPDDPTTKAAYLMVHHDLNLLPVVKDKKLEGIVRMIEIFDELSSTIL